MTMAGLMQKIYKADFQKVFPDWPNFARLICCAKNLLDTQEPATYTEAH